MTFKKYVKRHYPDAHLEPSGLFKYTVYSEDKEIGYPSLTPTNAWRSAYVALKV